MIATANLLRGDPSCATVHAFEEMTKAMPVAAKRITPEDAPAATNVVALPGHEPRASETAGATVPNDPSDARLLSSIARGEQSAFAELMQRHLSAVLASARRIVRDEAEAEDIAQEAFLRLWRTAETLEAGTYGMRPWLRRVASNLAIDNLRKTKRLDVTDEVPEQMEEPAQLKSLEAVEAAVRVDAAVRSLPPRQRVAVSLFHFDEMSQREVAQAMDLSEDALESLLARGRRRLRELLKNDWRELLAHSSDPT